MVQLTSRGYFAVLSTVLILDSIQSRPIGSVTLTNRETSITSSTSIQDENNLVTRARLPIHQTPLFSIRSEKEEEQQEGTKPPKNFGRLSSNHGVTAHAFTENELSALQNPHRKRNNNNNNTSSLVAVGGNDADDEVSENEASDGTGDIADEMYPLRIRETTTNTFKPDHLPFDQGEGKNKLKKGSLRKKYKRNTTKRENGHESEESNHFWTTDDENGKGTYWVGNHAATQNGANYQQQSQPNSFGLNGVGGYAKLKKRSNVPDGHESTNHWTTDVDNGKGTYWTPQKPFNRRSPSDQPHNTNQHHNTNQYHNINQDHNVNQHHNKGKGTSSYAGNGNGEGEGGVGTEVAPNQMNTATQGSLTNIGNVNQPAVGSVAGVSGGGDQIATSQVADTTAQTNPAVANTPANGNGADQESKADAASTGAAPERRSILKKRNNVPNGHESSNHWTTDEDNGKGTHWTPQKPLKRRSPYDQPHNTNQHHNINQYHNANQDHNVNQYHNKGKSTASYTENSGGGGGGGGGGGEGAGENAEVASNQSDTATKGAIANTGNVNQPAAGVATSGAITTNQAAGTTTQTNPAVADTTANANGAVEEGKADTATTAAPERRSILRKRSNTKLWLIGRDGKEDEEEVNPALATYFNNSKGVQKRFISSLSMKKEKNELIKRQITDSEDFLTAQEMDDESSSDIDRELATEQKPEHIQGLEDVHDECMEHEKQGILPSGTCEAQRMSSALAGSVRKREESSAVLPIFTNSTTVESTKVPPSPTHVRPPSQTEMALEALTKLNDLQAKRNDVQEQEELIEKQIHDLFKEYPVLSATLAL